MFILTIAIIVLIVLLLYVYYCTKGAACCPVHLSYLCVLCAFYFEQIK